MLIPDTVEQIKQSEESDAPVSGRSLLSAYLFLAGAVGVITWYALILHEQFYKFQGPFYDSLSYYNFMARLMRLAQDGKWSVAFDMTIHNSTVVLPWLQVLFVAPFVQCHRWYGTLVQSFWLLVLAVTSFRYWSVDRKCSLPAALAFTLPFISMSMIFQRNGGLPDFRMDLLQYLLLSTTSFQLLSALSRRRLLDWILFGLFAGCTCLVRATSPVYLTLMYGPILAYELVARRSERGRYAIWIGVALLTVVLVCGWYFVANFTYLKYYYCDWNLDAHRRLHLRAALQHVAFVFRDIGPWWLAYAGAVQLNALFGSRLQMPTAKELLSLLKSINWRVLWMAAVPCIFLVAIGAGLNEFVSMPSAFIFLALLLPLTSVPPPVRRNGAALLCAAVATGVVTAMPFFAMAGLEKPWISARRSGVDKIEEIILTDMKARDWHVASVSCIAADKVDNRVLSNTLFFDKGFHLHPVTQALTRDDVLLWIDESLQYAAPPDWAMLEGATDSEKVDTFVRKCLKQDYLLVPTADSAVKLHANTATVQNLRVFEIRDRLLKSGKLTAVSKPIYATANEDLVIYRVQRSKRSMPTKQQLSFRANGDDARAGSG